MEIFNKNSKCKKCGCTVITIRFVVFDYDFNGNGSMERRCERCGYLWYEKPLDIQ